MCLNKEALVGTKESKSEIYLSVRAQTTWPVRHSYLWPSCLLLKRSAHAVYLSFRSNLELLQLLLSTAHTQQE